MRKPDLFRKAAGREEAEPMYQTTTYASPVGELTLASDGTALTGLWLEGQKHFGEIGRAHV